MIKSDIKKIFVENRIVPLHQLGQNFLINKKVIQKIIEAAQLKKSDTVLEIGPGTGALTKVLAGKVKKLICVEKDKKLAGLLQKKFKRPKQIKIIDGDVLKLEPEAYGLKPYSYKIVANLPYSITGAFFRKFLSNKTIPNKMVLMTQKEVARRLARKSPPFNLLALVTQFYGMAEIISIVSKENFWPRPRVDSAIVKIEIKKPLPKNKIEQTFFKVARAGFAQKRKTLLNSLEHNLKKPKNEIIPLLTGAKIDPSARAQEISLVQWITLSTLAIKAKI